MSYDEIMNKIKLLPEDCFDDLSGYIDFIIYKHKASKKKRSQPNRRLAEAMREALQISNDPLAKIYSTTDELCEELNSNVSNQKNKTISKEL